MDKLDPFNLFENFSYRCWAEDETRGNGVQRGRRRARSPRGGREGAGQEEKRNIKEEGLRMGGEEMREVECWKRLGAEWVRGGKARLGGMGGEGKGGWTGRGVRRGI